MSEQKQLTYHSIREVGEKWPGSSRFLFDYIERHRKNPPNQPLTVIQFYEYVIYHFDEIPSRVPYLAKVGWDTFCGLLVKNSLPDPRSLAYTGDEEVPTERVSECLRELINSWPTKTPIEKRRATEEFCELLNGE